MIGSNENEIAARLAALEKSNRSMRICLCLASLLALASVLVGAVHQTKAGPPLPDVLRAKKFELLDSEGRTRALLYMAEDGPGFGFFGKRGKRRVTLGAGPFGSVMAFHDGDGTPRLSLAASAELTHVTLQGGDKHVDINLAIMGPENAHMIINGRAKKQLVGLGFSPDDVSFRAGAQGNVAVNLGITKGNPNITMKNARGKTVFKKP